jgi:hypothetical protein
MTLGAITISFLLILMPQNHKEYLFEAVKHPKLF